VVLVTATRPRAPSAVAEAAASAPPLKRCCQKPPTSALPQPELLAPTTRENESLAWTTSVGVAVAVKVGVWVGVSVGLAVAVAVGVAVAVAVLVAVAVTVGVLVGV
jgi:hypothetical protein